MLWSRSRTGDTSSFSIPRIWRICEWIFTVQCATTIDWRIFSTNCARSPNQSFYFTKEFHFSWINRWTASSPRKNMFSNQKRTRLSCWNSIRLLIWTIDFFNCRNRKISKSANSDCDNNRKFGEENRSFGEDESVGRKSRLSDACRIKSKIEKNTKLVVMTRFFQFCKNKML